MVSNVDCPSDGGGVCNSLCVCVCVCGRVKVRLPRGDVRVVEGRIVCHTLISWDLYCLLIPFLLFR